MKFEYETWCLSFRNYDSILAVPSLGLEVLILENFSMVDFNYCSVIGTDLKSSQGKCSSSITVLWSFDALCYTILILDRGNREEFYPLRQMVSSS